jgi:thiol-disulfide isomerase/thioredoxin
VGIIIKIYFVLYLKKYKTVNKNNMTGLKNCVLLTPPPTTPTNISAVEKVDKNEIVSILSLDHRNKIISNNEHVIIKYTASWCGPCKKIQPHFSKLTADHPNIVFATEDIELDLGEQFSDISALPTFHFIRNGELKFTVEGCDPDKLIDTANRLTKLN